MNRVLVACVALLALAGGSATAAELSPYYQPGPAYNEIKREATRNGKFSDR